MTLQIDALQGGIGARIDVLDDLRVQNLSAGDRQALRAAFAGHSVLLLRGLSLDSESLLALTRVLGEPELHPVESVRLPDHPEIIEILHAPDTLAEGARSGGPDEIVGRIGWHADLMYMPRPSRGALLWALAVPEEGGETAFVDTTLAYEDLDDTTKRDLCGRRAVYRFKGKLFRTRNRRVEADRFSEVRHPIVHRVPGTEKLALNISPAAIRVDGLGDEQSERMIRALHEHTIQERFIYVHRWRLGDLVIFNNQRTLHSAHGHKRRYTRLLHRTTLKGSELDPVAP